MRPAPLRGPETSPASVSAPLASGSIDPAFILSLQTSAGNAAVTRMLGQTSSGGSLPVQRFESGEHAQMGAQAGQPEVVFTLGKVKITYGEMIALGDFYRDVDDLRKAPQEELSELVTLIRRDRDAALGKKDARGEPVKWVDNDEWEKATAGRKWKPWRPPDFVDLASKNDEHFAVENKKLWIKFHRSAIDLARKKKLDLALATSALGDHYLTDAFSAGHLIEKKKVRKEAETNMKRADLGKFAHAIAKHILENSNAQAALTGYEVADSPAPTFISPWRPVTVDSMADVVIFMHNHKADQFYSMFAKSIHDRLNKDIKEGGKGVLVKNGAGHEPWRLAGDQTLSLSPTTLEIIQEAVARSRQDIEDAAKDPKADVNAMIATVWSYTPEPTGEGEELVKGSEAELTNPAEWDTAMSWARIASENIDTLIEQLTGAHMMRKKAGATVTAPVPPGDYPQPAPGLAPA